MLRKILFYQETDTDNFVKIEIDNPHYTKPGSFKLPLELSQSKTLILQVDASMIRGFLQEDISSFKNENTNAKKIIFPENENGDSNNPITKAYESGMSRGLAGFITQLDVNYNEVNWETGRIGSKAPILVKITCNFAPIHDIPPGLDHNGMLRAPIYNVGRINNQFFGDSQDKNYTGEGFVNALQKYKKIKSNSL